jgi:CHAD domain-containing protein
MTRPREQAQPNPPLEPDQRSELAVRQILVHLLDTLRANIDGVLEDLDPEPLHDLRVATRRTRSALSTIKGVLPEAVVNNFAHDFKWLGTVTGPCRDLDVQLIEMDDFQRRLEIADGSLDPLRKLIEKSRRDERPRVCDALRSERFRRLIDGWDEILDANIAGEPEPRNARRPVIELAGERIHKAFRRFVKRGSKLAGDAPARAFHRLRIDAKKLRYLLEFFADLYPEETARRLVKELKRLQDTLGGFNDMAVQRARLATLASQLTASDTANPETVIAMDRLAQAMAERQDEHRRAFADRFASFAGTDNRRLYRETFGTN